MTQNKTPPSNRPMLEWPGGRMPLAARPCWRATGSDCAAGIIEILRTRRFDLVLASEFFLSLFSSRFIHFNLHFFPSSCFSFCSRKGEGPPALCQIPSDKLRRPCVCHLPIRHLNEP